MGQKKVEELTKKLEGFEVTELDDQDLEDAAGGNCNCGCGGGADLEHDAIAEPNCNCGC